MAAVPSEYVKGKQLGEGTWGSVYEAHRKSDNLKVAIKRIKPMEAKLGMNFTALREIKYLREIHHANIIKLEEVFISGGILHLVLEFCPFDLENVIRDKTILLRPSHIKSYLRMMLQGIDCCHKNFILHRDLKPANLLFGLDGCLKIADFGLARNYSSPGNMTSEVCTRWYRSPELLFGAPLYSGAIDIWAAGCIFAEMLFRVPLFPGDSDIEQLGKIFNVLGTPTEANFPGVELLPNYIPFEHRDPLNLLPLFRKSSSSSAGLNTSVHTTAVKNHFPLEMDLMMWMLTLNPNKRCTTTEALQHAYFTTSPYPSEPSQLPLPAKVNRKSMVYNVHPPTTIQSSSHSSSQQAKVPVVAKVSQKSATVGDDADCKVPSLLAISQETHRGRVKVEVNTNENTNSTLSAGNNSSNHNLNNDSLNVCMETASDTCEATDSPSRAGNLPKKPRLQ